MHELIILGFLQESSMHGYELKSRADSLLAGIFTVSYGSLYPKFKQLEHKGFITATSTFSEGGQQKIVYSITNQGRGYFHQLMTREYNESFQAARARFKLRTLFFNHLDFESILPVIKTFKELLAIEITTLEKTLSSENENLLPYQKAALLNSYDLLKLKAQWVNSLMR